MKLLRNRLFRLIVTAVCLIVIFTLSRSIFDLLRRRDVVKERQQELARVEAENAKLRSQLQEVQSPDFIERMAREKLGLVKEGETVVFLPEATESASFTKPTENLPNWKRWWQLFF